MPTRQAAVELSPPSVPPDAAAPVVTVIYPCLNEAEAIGDCVDRALGAIAAAGVTGEVLVVDNGSSDGSAEIARARGARVVSEPRRGYGSAYQRGFREARGEFIVMLDADGTYPVEMLREFLEPLRRGAADLVLGNRFAGRMQRGAMPFMNRYLGNPVLSGMTRALFRNRLKDFHCGMRAFRREKLAAVPFRMPGMEFATEMLVKALDHDLAIAELDIPYRPRVGESKLMPLRDAWRHVEYMLMYSPAATFLWPGAMLALFGVAVQLFLLHGPRSLWLRTWDMHTNVAGLASALVGLALVNLGLVSAAFAWQTGMRFRHSLLGRWAGRLSARAVRLAGLSFTFAGAGYWAVLVAEWALSGFGAIAAIPDMTLATTLLAGGFGLSGAAFIVQLIRVSR